MQNIDVISLILFIAVIVLAFFRKTNVGVLALAVGVIAVRLFGMTDKDLMGGISSSMFCTLVGITLLFAIVNQTGALELLARKIVAASGGHVWMIPIAVYLSGFIVAGIGPGAVPALAIIPALAVSIAVQIGYNPLMLALIGTTGLMAGRMTPITPEAAIITNAAAEAGIENVMWTVLVCKTLITLVMAVIVFIVYKGYKLKQPTIPVQKEALPKFDRKQILALCGIVLMMVLLIFCDVNVGVAAFAVSAILLLIGVADDVACIKALPWTTIVMVLGVGALLDIVNAAGGIDMMSNALSSIMTSSTATPIMGVSAALLSFVSSALGVVYPTMIPMCADVAAEVGGVNTVALMAAVGAGGSLADLSPLSTGGALCLAALGSGVKDFDKEKQSKAFVQLLLWSLVGIVVVGVVSGLFFTPIANLFHPELAG